MTRWNRILLAVRYLTHILIVAGQKNVLFDFLLAYPNSRSSDVIKVLFEYLGMVKPL